MVESARAFEQLDHVRAQLERRGDADLATRVGEATRILRGSTGVEGDELLSPDRVAKMLGVRSVDMIKRWASEGLLEGYRVGGHVKVTRRSVDALRDRPPVAELQAYERRADEALAPFDAGDDELPETGAAHIGRKPWEHTADPQR
jgi:excisionase family DNA binding protein